MTTTIEHKTSDFQQARNRVFGPRTRVEWRIPVQETDALRCCRSHGCKQNTKVLPEVNARLMLSEFETSAVHLRLVESNYSNEPKRKIKRQVRRRPYLETDME